MTLDDYRQRYADLLSLVNSVKSNFESYLYETKKEFQRLYLYEQLYNKQWFATHLDYILRHQTHFQNSELGKIVIDFLWLYREAGYAAGVAWDSAERYKIYLKDLIHLWDNGFTYKGYPIISYQVIIHNGKKIIIDYVKNRQIETATQEYENGFNSLELPNQLISSVKSLNVADQYPDWTIYKTINIIRDTIEHRKSGNGYKNDKETSV